MESREVKPASKMLEILADVQVKPIVGKKELRMFFLGWGDPINLPVVLVYRRKGNETRHEFSGPVGVLGEDRKSITWVTREELPLAENRLDLTKVPVIGIGGKRRHQPGRAQRFLEENPSFQGAILLYPGSGSWDLGEGMLFVTSREVLAGQRVSGGRPEVQFTNYRWLYDGRYVADRARMLHGKVLETLETAVEQMPGAEEIVKTMAELSCPVKHRLHDMCRSVLDELNKLERRRVMFSGEQTRDMTALVRERVLAKLQNADVRSVADIPNDFTVSAEEIDPELVSQRDTLGTIDVPGLGRRLPYKQCSRFGFGGEVLAVKFSIEEFRALYSWPFNKVYPVLFELGDATRQMDYGLQRAVVAPEDERVGKLREYFSQWWLDVQRDKNYPKDIPVVSPREADLPQTPEPMQWGHDLLTGEPRIAYAGLRKSNDYWSFRWFDNVEKAAKADAEARQEAESYITARRLEAELTANAQAVPFPMAMPTKPKELDDYELPDEAREEMAVDYQTKVREFVAALEVAPQWSCLPLKLAAELKEAAEYGYDLGKFVPRLCKAWAQAEQLRQLRDTGEILVNWGGHFRVMGRTGNAQYWVIRPNGQERLFDEVTYRKRYTSEGEKFWRVIGREELAISWFKNTSAAPHHFVVNHAPVGGLTPEQLAFAAKLEAEIAADWKGARGLASGEPSPPIGDGWGLGQKPEASPDEPTEERELADLSAVNMLFGVPVRRISN